jgi:hypothetical protein
MSNPVYLNERTTLADVQCLILGRLGFPHKTIAKATGLKEGQVGYRLKCGGVSTMEYRRGETLLAQRVIQAAKEDSREYFNTMISNIRRYLKD